MDVYQYDIHPTATEDTAECLRVFATKNSKNQAKSKAFRLNNYKT